MVVRRRHVAMVAASAVVAGLLAPAAGAGGAQPPVRFATFNASLNRNNAGQALAELSVPGNVQADRWPRSSSASAQKCS